MGTLSLPSIRDLASQAYAKQLEPATGNTPPGQAKKIESNPSAADVFAAQQPAGTSESDAFFYQSQFERIAFSANVQSLSLQQSSEGEDGSTKTTTLNAQQLQFDFVAESRYEELAIFRQKTGAVAEGLEGAQQESYIAASQRISARFEASVSVSTSVLSGFSGASEELGSDAESLGKLTDLTDEALKKVDEILNKVFELLDDFFKGSGDLKTRFDNLFAELQKLQDTDFGLGNAAAKNAGTTTTSTSVQLEFNFQFSFSGSVQVQQTGVQQSDPITFDLDNDGIELSSYQNGAKFDITGKGAQVTTAFVNGGDAFLALDRNKNGIVDDGTELFGDQRGAANGFEELRKLDSNSDGKIDKYDVGFDALMLFRDNGNGKTEDGELFGLSAGGIAEIDLRYKNVKEITSGGNTIGQTAAYRRNDGTQGRVVDSILNYKA